MTAPSSSTPSNPAHEAGADSVPMSTPAPNRSLVPLFVAGVAGIAFCLVCAISALVLYHTGADKTKAAGMSRFDENDLDATKEWAWREVERFPVFPDNKVAQDDAINAFNMENARHIGKRFRWKFIASVVKQEPIFDPAGGLRNADVVLPQGFWTYPDAPAARYLSIEPLVLEVGKAINRDAASRIRVATPIIVTGTIRNVTIHTAWRQPPMVLIALNDDLKAE